MLLSLLIFFQVMGLQGWELFEEVEYELQYVEEFGYEVEIPVFPESILAEEGKDYILAGHYLPFDVDEKTIIISKLPYASCFFCGSGVGPETIGEIHLAEPLGKRIKPDKIIRIQGKLKLNNSDFNHFVFILEEAVILED